MNTALSAQTAVMTYSEARDLSVIYTAATWRYASDPGSGSQGARRPFRLCIDTALKDTRPCVSRGRVDCPGLLMLCSHLLLLSLIALQTPTVTHASLKVRFAVYTDLVSLSYITIVLVYGGTIYAIAL